MDPYATHLPVLKKILECACPETAVEFGMGLYSTPMLLEKCENLLSVEMNSLEWYSATIHAIKGKSYQGFWRPVFLPPEVVLEMWVPRTVELCLVDGHGDNRPECANLMFGQCPTIVIHDTEEPSYGWERLRPPVDYMRWDSTDVPRTTVFTTDTEVLACLGAS